MFTLHLFQNAYFQWINDIKLDVPVCALTSSTWYVAASSHIICWRSHASVRRVPTRGTTTSSTGCVLEPRSSCVDSSGLPLQTSTRSVTPSPRSTYSAATWWAVRGQSHCLPPHIQCCHLVGSTWSVAPLPPHTQCCHLVGSTWSVTLPPAPHTVLPPGGQYVVSHPASCPTYSAATWWTVRGQSPHSRPTHSAATWWAVCGQSPRLPRHIQCCHLVGRTWSVTPLPPHIQCCHLVGSTWSVTPSTPHTVLPPGGQNVVSHPPPAPHTVLPPGGQNVVSHPPPTPHTVLPPGGQNVVSHPPPTPHTVLPPGGQNVISHSPPAQTEGCCLPQQCHISLTNKNV